MSFKDRIRRINQALEAAELTVLVWGPGPQANEHYQKREKIRLEIRNCFKNADVQFSEDLDEAVPGSKYLTFPEKELYHLIACDICVVLDTSRGPGEEIAYFAGSHYARKLLILTHERDKDARSFPASLRERGNQFFYSEEEYATCSLVELVLTRLKVVAIMKMGRLLI